MSFPNFSDRPGRLSSRIHKVWLIPSNLALIQKLTVTQQVGLLPKSNYQQVPFAYKMYSREDETGWKQSAAFKKAFSINVDIELLAVWCVTSDLCRR
jgi:hypothetical protein